MDYEKLHKDTITKLQQMVNSGKITVETACGICADFVPESEDERIRKGLIDTFSIYYKDEPDAEWDGKPVKDILAWLEKQGEQKLPIEKLPSEMKTVGESLGFTTQKECDDYNKMVTELIMSDDDKGEQKPAEWHRKDEQNLNACLGYIPDEFLRRWLTDIIHIKYDKPAWSEEDESLRLRTIGALETCKIGYPTKCVDEQINWLKSIKDRYTWKPSDEQMDALNYVVNLMASSERPTENDLYYNVFKDLREQLKKLKS